LSKAIRAAKKIEKNFRAAGNLEGSRGFLYIEGKFFGDGFPACLNGKLLSRTLFLPDSISQ
jgi:hypothetical protein